MYETRTVNFRQLVHTQDSDDAPGGTRSPEDRQRGGYPMKRDNTTASRWTKVVGVGSAKSSVAT